MSEPINEQPPRTIAIDFDGVIHSYTSGWTGFDPIDPPVVGARAAIAAMRAMGFQVIVFSCRAHDYRGLAGIVLWLHKHEITVDNVTAAKPHAEIYVDDRGWRFTGDWEEIVGLARAIPRPWNAKGRFHGQ